MGLDITGIGAVSGLIGNVIDKIWPDPAQRAQANLELLKLQQSGELASMLAQTDINKVEAASASLFTSGWRPGVGWTCVLGLIYTFLGWPLATWASGIWHFPAPPALDMGTLITLLGGMLGLGGLRTVEKLNGVAAK